MKPSPFDTEAAPAPASQAEALREMSRQSGRPPGKLAAEFARLAAGRGKLSFQDYVEMRVFDDAFLEDSDKTAFAGRRVNSELINDINHDRDSYILATNKLAGAGLLSAYGFATPETRAVYKRGLGSTAGRALGDVAALAAHLRTSTYPLFGKPVDGEQSLGALGLLAGPGDDGRLTLSGGGRATPEELAADIDAHFPSGYLLQTPLVPPSEIAAVTGGALGTLRILTVQEDGAARVLRACLKLPIGGNVADNYWRSGNVLAQVDIASGRILAGTTGSGLSLRVLNPDIDLDGGLRNLGVPAWSSYLQTAEQAHGVIEGLSLIGWDIGVTCSGPVIVEANAAPNNLLVQLADRRGLLEPSLMLLAEHGRKARKEKTVHSKRDLLTFINHK